MFTLNDTSSMQFRNETEKNIAFEQYKILADSIGKTNETRENSNNFWITVNGIATSALAYMRDAQTISMERKSFLLWTIIVIGMFLCLSWFSYLWTIKKSLEIRNTLLVDLEKYFPVPIFKTFFALTQKKPDKSSLTIKEMFVPTLFLIGYFFFAFLLFFFTEEVITPSSQSE